ncbi:hypothetical protein [Streptomyces chartreusis]|uniref:hypothetical protein n=1 Tax=Streptomyces chartreusis TaxID=1969 RepID=UPI0036482CE9
MVIGKGEAILGAHAAAGRHPVKYGEDAGHIDFARADKEYLAFGHGVPSAWAPAVLELREAGPVAAAPSAMIPTPAGHDQARAASGGSCM